MNSEKTIVFLKELGLDIQDDSSLELICVCPFCDDEKKHFYLNSEKVLYDCKVCGESGSYRKLMEQLAINLAGEMTDERLELLAKNRKLPLEAFRSYGIGWTGTGFTVPVEDERGNVVNVQKYRLGHKLFSAPGCPQTLYGVSQLVDESIKDYPVFIAEGFWDLVALRWIIEMVEAKALVVSAPGANIFKPEWSKFFTDRKVIIAYDNDEAGAKGEAKVAGIIRSSASSIKFIGWNDCEDNGKDVRDLIIEGLK